MLRKVYKGLSILLVCQSVFGGPITILGPVGQSILQAAPSRPSKALSLSQMPLRVHKQVTLLKIRLSSEAKQVIETRIHESSGQDELSFVQYPRQIQLGMNGVPVLDQGIHGNCTIFAITAAIDAVIGKGDFMSQMCLLQLGRYLENNSYTASGWNGAWGQMIYDRIEMFGFVPKLIQTHGGCAGVTEYPANREESTTELTVADYHQISESIQENNIIISPLMLPMQINSKFKGKDVLLHEVKRILTQGDRVTASLLLNYNQGHLGALGSHHVAHDTWTLSSQVADHFDEEDDFASHSFVITGYNDDAIATDSAGRLHRGLLTLRHSWGSLVGDRGDFYVTYSYFKAFLLEAHHVGRAH